MKKDINCSICSIPISENFCNRCGQKYSSKKLTTLSLFADLFSNSFYLEKSGLVSIVKILSNPRHIVQNYFSGFKNYYASPGKIMMYGIAVLTLHLLLVDTKVLGVSIKINSVAIGLQYSFWIFFYPFLMMISYLGFIRQKLDFSKTESNPVRCPDAEIATKMEAYIKSIRKEGETIGGTISCVIQNVPVGLGEPVFDKLHAQLGKAMLSINAVKGFEYGSGFAGTKMKGSEHNDIFNSDGSTKTNHSGGIQGGISNGEDIYFKVAFKPVATIMQKQETIDSKGNRVEADGKGRHDPCVVPRAVPIVEAMAAMVLADFWLLNKISKI